MAANTTFVSGAILTAAQMNALPWGVVDATAGGTSGRGFVTRTAGNITVTTTLADVTGMTATFTPVTGRLYKASFALYVENGATAQIMQIQITNAANTVQFDSVTNLFASNGSALVSGFVVLTGLSGSTQLKLRSKTGTNNAAILAVSGLPASFVVEDIGPST
jgi:hypothetical protein